VRRALALLVFLALLMALSKAVRTFTWLEASAIGTTIDVDFGFTPKLLVGFMSGNPNTSNNVTGTNAYVHQAIGFGISSSNRRACVLCIVDGSAAADLAIGHSDAIFMSVDRLVGGSLDIDAEANWPANSVRFIVDVKIVSGWGNMRVSVLALGGTDIAEANIVTAQEHTSAATQTVAHGLSGGAPTGCLLMSVGFGTAPPNSSTSLGMLSFGAADGTRSWVTYIGGDDAAATMDNVSYALTGGSIAMGAEPAVTTTARAGVPTFDATNVSIPWIERAATRYYFLLVWRGGQFYAGSTTTRTDTTGFNGPTNGFIAEAALFASCNRAASTADTPTAHSAMSIGAGISTTERVAQSMFDQDATANCESAVAIAHDAVYTSITTADAQDGLMDITSVAADPWTLVMDDADATASFVGVASWGPNAGGAAATPHGPLGLPLNGPFGRLFG